MKNLIFFLFLFFNLISFSQKDMTKFCYENNKKIVSKLNIDSLELVLINKINSFREKNGLNRLTIDSTLSNYSKNWSLNMYKTNTMYHSNIQSNGIVAENLYKTVCFGTFPMDKGYINEVANRIFTGWTKSEEHKNNMLNKNINNIGVSIILIPNGMVDEYSTMVVK